ncbi:MAG: hypothetical protein HKN20_09260 [Gemmatimonadetes bacterium]|nr:hypothetical protein [Gemmatimonadota bacterium]
MWIDLPAQEPMDPAEAAAIEWRAPHTCAAALPPAANELFAKDDVFYYHTEHFAIGYVTEGEHAVSSNEYLDSLGSVLEQAYRAFRDELGMLAPPVFRDSTDPAFGRIPITPWNAPPGVGGLAGALEFHGECPNSAVPRIAIDSKLNPKGTVLRLITAHEVFHGFQYARNRWATGGNMMFESTARWSEIVAHPDLFHNWNVQGHFNETYRYLLAHGDFDRGDRFQYGRAIWWYFLDELLGFPVAPVVWERVCPNDAGSHAVLRAILNENGYTLEEAFYLFTEWNLFTGPRNVGRHYVRADELPLVWFQKQHRKGETGTFTIDEDEIAERLAANYVKIHGPATRAHLEIVFRGDAALDRNRRVILAGTTSTGSYEIHDFALENGSGSVTLRDWARFEEVALVVMNGDLDEDQDRLRAYDYEIREKGEEVWDMNWLPSDLTRLRTAPNPFALGTSIRFRAEGSEPVRADVYDIAGRRVAMLAARTYPDGEHEVTWHGRADSGELVAAGKYFLRVEQGSWRETRSLVIAR